MNTLIKQTIQSDLESLEKICLKTAFDGRDASGLFFNKTLLASYFVAPYLKNKINGCLVSFNEQGISGYLVGTDDTTRFNHWLNNDWLPEIRKKFPQNLDCSSELEEFVLEKIHTDAETEHYAADYPSHFHISLLPAAQKSGIGTKLLELFSHKMSLAGSNGIHLQVSKANGPGFQFFKKNGFQIIAEDEVGFVLGKQF